MLFKCKIDWTNSKFSSDNFFFFQWQLAFAGCKVIPPSSAICFARSLGWLGPPSFWKISPGKKMRFETMRFVRFFSWGVDSWPRLDKRTPVWERPWALRPLKKSPVQPVFLINVALRNPSATFSGRKNGLEGPSLRTTLNLFSKHWSLKNPSSTIFLEKAGLENCWLQNLSPTRTALKFETFF